MKKVLIAAAGKGTRMLHLTRNKPKHLIKVENKPFLVHLLNNILEAGYSDIVIVVGYKGEAIKQCLENYKVKATIINQFEILGEKEYGTLCPIKCAEETIGKENFLAVYGDNYYSVEDLKSFNIDDEYNYVGGLVHQNPSKYGVLISDNGFLKEIKEKPKEFFGNLINTGLYKFTPEVFKKVPEVKISQRGEYELTDAISLLAKEGKVKIKKIKDGWLDFGNPADIMKVSNFLKHNGNLEN